jgi:hypothetical protein
MLSSILTTIGLPALMRILSEALGVIDTPATQRASEALVNVEQAWRDDQITLEQRAEANRHAEKMAELESEKHVLTLTQINETMRTELNSEDKYIRRMRPTFGYLMAFTWAAQMLGIAYVIVFDTSRAGVILNAMSSLSAIWAVGLSVLGIYVYKRSEDKKGRYINPLPQFTAPTPPQKPAVNQTHETITWNE